MMFFTDWANKKCIEVKEYTKLAFYENVRLLHISECASTMCASLIE